MNSPPVPLWKTLRAPALTAEALLAATATTTVPVDVDDLARKLGVLLLPMERDDSQGCLWFKGHEAHLSVNRVGAPVRRRFTQAALLCHLLRHPEGTYHRYDQPTSGLEEEALEFASDLLIPDRILRPLLPRGDAFPDVATLAKKFWVSQAAMEMRLRKYEGEFGWTDYDAPGPASHEPPSGLPPLAEDPWKLFGVSPGTPLAEIKPAYHLLLSQYHPDKYEHLAPELKGIAERRTREIIAAFEWLTSQTETASVPAPAPARQGRDAGLQGTDSEVADVLKKARWWITHRGWCQGAQAKDGYGKKVVLYNSERAGQFSIVGAVWRAAGESLELRNRALSLVAMAVKERPRFLDNWNDRPGRA
ncbi:MAG TPA: ImmA/IrrE family metallo-endopeptidase, partial [Myxococcaceae bacterium]|nr:ImmA/IrrE family metallo-endopeptidase [Myxococcaceae bacterium]